ncbi:MAG: nitroreductase family protein [Candidatus Asgardarchaeia archaeon]
MGCLERILARRSIRKYKKMDIPDDVLMKILEAGRLAPSAKNVQPWHFIIVKDSELKKKLSTGRWNQFIKDAPICIVGCGDTRSAPRWHIIDVTIALQNMVLAAACMGIGSCWIGDFKEDEVKELLKIPEHFKVIALITFGYPDESPEPFGKRKLEEIASIDKYGNAFSA